MDSRSTRTTKPGETVRRPVSQPKPAELAAQRLSFWKRHRFSLAGLAVGAAILGVGAFLVYDLRQTQTHVQQLYAGSVRGLDRVGELQNQINESRRHVLLALSAPDSKARAEHSEQSRAADARVAGLIQPKLPETSEFEEAGSRLL